MSTPTRTLPAHGTRACYLRGCRRDECRDAHYQYMSRYRLDAHRGQRRRTDAGPAAQRARELAAAGWSHAQIGAAAGSSEWVARGLLHGVQRTIRRDISARILAINPNTLPTPASNRHDATGTIRRVQALVAIGWPLSHIAAAVGLDDTSLGRTINHPRTHVLASTARAIANLYRQWSARPGPSDRARRHAARRGWHGPLAWGDNIDDPAAQPDLTGVAPPQPTAARDDTGELAAEVRHLALLGESPWAISKAVGRSESRVKQLLPKRAAA